MIPLVPSADTSKDATASPVRSVQDARDELENTLAQLLKDTQPTQPTQETVTEPGNEGERGTSSSMLPTVVQTVDVGQHVEKYHCMIRHLLVDFGDYILDSLVSSDHKDEKIIQRVGLVRQAMIDPLRLS